MSRSMQVPDCRNRPPHAVFPQESFVFALPYRPTLLQGAKDHTRHPPGNAGRDRNGWLPGDEALICRRPGFKLLEDLHALTARGLVE